MWAVYERPADYPESFVARRWRVAGGAGIPTADVMVAPTLAAIREELERRGLVPLPRSEMDPPQVIETWI